MKIDIPACFLLISMIQPSWQYKKLAVEDESLCSITRNRRIKLEKGPHSGLIVSQNRLNEHRYTWEYNERCKFQVSPSSSKEGVIAVIQALTFRKNATTDECIDYVQFSKKDGSTSPKFCGRFNAALKMDHNFENERVPIATGNSFVDEKGQLDVEIFVDKERLKDDEETDVSIVFTAYKPCNQVLKKDTMYKPCSEKRTQYCIYSGFFSDSYVNCPFPDCEDEQGCSKSTEVIGDYYYGNKVLVGAVSSVFVVFALFILCLWICKTYRVFCWSQSFASPATSSTPHNQPNETPRVIEMNEARSSASHSNATNAVDEDKDLPPSYDSLFPDR